VDSANLTDVLGQLLDWARANCIDLAGLQVAPPSLEDTYSSSPLQPPERLAHARTRAIRFTGGDESIRREVESAAGISDHGGGIQTAENV
jgi:hypothetical protein